MSKNEQLELEEEIQMEEIQNAIKDMALNKTPGTDGFQVNFYVCFFTRIKDYLLQAYQFSIKCNRLYSSVREGIITLLPKSGRNLDFIKNWRPITLLNTDYKIFSKVIANRLKKHLAKLIHPDQTGFLKGHNISENLRRIFDIMEFTFMKKLPAVIVAIDFEKAFNRVEYKALKSIMKWYNFGPNFINYVMLLFKDFRLVTINNGHSSEPFIPTRGLFQGNPIASYAFLLVMELLATKLRSHKDIQGITVKDTKNLLAQFADDLTLFLKFNQKSWSAIENMFSEFEIQTGMKINYDKSLVYRIGSLENSNAKFYSQKKLVWSNEPLKILGVYVAYSRQKVQELNINPLLDKAKTIIDLWKYRDLSLFGKTLLLNLLVASLFVYRLAVIEPLSKEHVTNLIKMFSQFIWNWKKPKIKYNCIQSLKTDDGVGLVNMRNKDTALKLQWVFKLQDNSSIKNLAYAILADPIGDLIWKNSIEPKSFSVILLRRLILVSGIKVVGKN